MKTANKLVFALLALGSAPMVLLAQQPAPNYDETAAWIRTKLIQFGSGMPGDPSYWLSYDSVSMGSCVFKFRQQLKDSADFDHRGVRTPFTITNAYEVDLTKVSTVIPSAFAVIIESSTDSIVDHLEKSDSRTWLVQDSNGTYRRQKVNLFCSNNPQTDCRDLIIRMQKAIANAVNICRAQAPKSNEPF